MGYELWDRSTGNLILDFGDRESALAFVRDQIDGLDARAAEQEVDRMALVRVTDDGRTSEVLAQASGLLTLILAPSSAG